MMVSILIRAPSNSGKETESNGRLAHRSVVQT